MADLGAARAKKRGGALAKLKAKQDNGEVKPAAAKGALAKLRQSKQKPKGALGALKGRKRSSPLDFVEDDILYHNVHITDADIKGGAQGTVDATKKGKKKSKTYTFHNRHGAWYHDTAEGKRHSPYSLTVAQNLILRFEKELKAQGIPTRGERRAQEDEKEQAKRKRLAELEAKREAKKAAKQSS